MACHESEDVDNLLAFPHHVLERILGHLDQVQDILALGSASGAAQAAVAHASWTGVHCLRLSHGAPSPASAAWIAAKCPGLVELRAEGCTQLTPESLQGFSQAALEVLLLGENPSLQGKLAAAAILAIARHGKLGNLALPNLPGVMLDILRKSKNLSRLSASQLSWKASVGSSSLGQLCPKLTHLTLAHCVFGHGCDRSIGCPAGLQHLTLCGSIMFGVPAGVIPFLSPKLKSVDISSTQIADNELREIVATCHHLQHLNLSQCVGLTDVGIAALGTAPSVTSGRLWYLNISELGPHFTGATLYHFLMAWATAKLQGMGTAPTSLRTDKVPHLHLNISHNLKFRPDFLLGLTLPGCDWALGAVVSLQEFSARSCTRLAGPYLHEDPAENIFRDLSAYGLLSKLHTLDLSDVFSTSQQSDRQKERMLTGIIESTCGHLKKLHIDNTHVGEEAAWAIAQKCTQLEELSMPGCAGLTDLGLRSIALACKRLQSLRIGGGPSKAWKETDGLLAFSHLRELEICRRSLMTDDQLVQVLGQHPALETFKMSSCPRVSDKGLAALPASTLRVLRLVCCDGIAANLLGRLKRLERLTFTSCNAVTGDAIQVIAVSCTRLKALQLPKHIPTSCVPTQAVGHLRGLQVTGGSMAAPPPKAVRRQ